MIVIIIIILSVENICRALVTLPPRLEQRLLSMVRFRCYHKYTSANTDGNTDATAYGYTNAYTGECKNEFVDANMCSENSMSAV